jgi:hypothetical protein
LGPGAFQPLRVCSDDRGFGLRDAATEPARDGPGPVLPKERNGNGGDPQNAEIKAIVDVTESVTSQSRHSLRFAGVPTLR